MAIEVPKIDPTTKAILEPKTNAAISKKVADDIAAGNTPVASALNAASAEAMETPGAPLREATTGVFVDRGGIHIDPSSPTFGGTPLPDDSGAGADSTAALKAALDYARNTTTFFGKNTARRIHLNGWYKFTEDLRLDEYAVEIEGEGGNSGLLGIGASVVLGGTTKLTMRQGLRNLRIRRVTSAGNEHGTALLIEGGAMDSNKYPCRWYLDHVEVEAPVHPSGLNPQNAVATVIRGTFLATITALYCRSAYKGLSIENDAVAGNMSAQALTFIGGEIQGVRHIGSIDNAYGIAFFGMAWEGASEGGMTVDDTNGFTVHGGYFEANYNYDIRIGEVSACTGVSIVGGYSSVGIIATVPAAMANKRSIILRNAKGVDLSGISFASYDVSPVLVNEVSAGAVVGGHSNLFSTRPLVPAVQVQAGTLWNAIEYGHLRVTGKGRATTFLDMEGPAQTQRFLRFLTGTTTRWAFGANTDIENGSNNGSNLALWRYTDAGAYVDAAFTVVRSTGQMRLHKDVRLDAALDHDGTTVGFYGKTPVTRPELTYSKATETPAEAQLRAALTALGLVTDSTVA